MVETAFSVEIFAALLSPFVAKENKPLAVAVSGGPDSMALAFLSAKTVGAKNLLALIVEHGLRDESAREAAAVAQNLRALGIETEILPWTHDEVKSRVHVRARDARYGLLIEACKRRGIDTLLIAHHADDQAETVLMRFAKGSGIDGLAGMEPVTVVEGVRLVRPLLAVPKARLIATCEANGVPFVIDPSNATAKYARGRLRRVMPLLASEGFTPERLLDLADRAREARDALSFYTDRFLQESVQRIDGGAFRLELAALRGLPRAVALRALTALLAALHRDNYAPERKQLLPLYAWLTDQDEGESRTLGGVIVQKGDLCDRAIFLREPEAISDCQPIVAGQTVLWDGRWCVTGIAAESLEVRALGTQPHELLDRLAPRLRARVPQGRVRAGLPALWRGDELVAIPAFTEQDQGVARAVSCPVAWEEIL